MNKWIYKDAIGIERIGTLEQTIPGQGSDITYVFKREDGKLDLVSGQRLKEARRLP